MSGPKGQTVTLAVCYRGDYIFDVLRYPTNKRLVFPPAPLDEKGHLVEQSIVHSSCGKRVVTRVEPDAKKFIGTADDDHPGVEAAASKLREMQEGLDKVKASIPEKYVCTECDNDVVFGENVKNTYFCTVCEVSIDTTHLGYELEGGGHRLLSDEEVGKLESLRMTRGINVLGLVPVDFSFNLWQIEDSWGLTSVGGWEDEFHGMLAALRSARRPLFVEYCSKNETKPTLKNEWMAILESNKEGTALLLTTLRHADDIYIRHNEPTSLAESASARAWNNLLGHSELPLSVMEGLPNDPPARHFLRSIMEGKERPPFPLDTRADLDPGTKQRIKEVIEAGKLEREERLAKEGVESE